MVTRSTQRSRYCERHLHLGHRYAANNHGQTTVTDTHTISIEVPLAGAVIFGPITVSLNVPHAYHVSALPITATQPITYVWNPEPDQGQGTDVATYVLADLGEHTLNVYVSNLGGPSLSVTHTVTSVPPLTAVNIDGPTDGRLFAILTFTATTQPDNAALPISYLWSPAPVNGQGTGQAAYQWTSSGAHLISVTVRNDGGPVSGSHELTIIGSMVYLPIVRRD